MREIKPTVHPFRMGTDKEVANKVLEEASEAREAAQQVRYCNPSEACREYNFRYTCEALLSLADKFADCIQACIDLAAAMDRCEKGNRDGGRYS